MCIRILSILNNIMNKFNYKCKLGPRWYGSHNVYLSHFILKVPTAYPPPTDPHTHCSPKSRCYPRVEHLTHPLTNCSQAASSSGGGALWYGDIYALFRRQNHGPFLIQQNMFKNGLNKCILRPERVDVSMSTLSA